MEELGAGIGVGCADYNRDGRPDLRVSNFRHQINGVFWPDGRIELWRNLTALGPLGLSEGTGETVFLDE